MLRFAPFALLVLLAAPVAAFAAQESDHEIHEELRGILQTLQASINSGNFDAMLPVISKDVRATTITQEVLSSHSNVSSYFNKWFGPGGYLKKLEMKLDADALTELSPEKTWGLVRGSGLENYTLSDGRFYPMKTRWTAVVAKEDDGKWRLRAIHIGTNFLDNPILSEAEAAAKKYTAFGIAGGLVVGVGLGFLFGRRKK
jgi:ketosteroid isomerase-like protein